MMTGNRFTWAKVTFHLGGEGGKGEKGG